MCAIISDFDQRRLVSRISKRLTRKDETRHLKRNYNFSNHGSQEMGKGLEKKILKDAGIKK